MLSISILTHPQAESQGASPCIIRGISIRRPAVPRSQTCFGGRQILNHSFPWNSRGVRAQGSPECENLSGIPTSAWGRRGASPVAWNHILMHNFCPPWCSQLQPYEIIPGCSTCSAPCATWADTSHILVM